ncbi:hypothetical protein UK23_01940 [Lentzea aerocolonigenes]|uniref:NfeD-like C-terminal domain-containing protein n=1 Tax=Lentzea aerocolonigenes TaxID=68170 RepID=A0A0F0HFI7_LENAE|nr:hypothetical protein [Lentzea aerocolonigenes]KJK53097.1 hypothetical protein UK23_01940 [Lentzea aerocolonigenes]
MTEFVAAALAFPTVLFSFLMLVVLAYWLTVVLVGIDFDAPVLPLSISMFVLITWFAALAGTVLTPEGKLRYAVLAGALLAGALITKILSIPLRNWTRPEKPASRNDFVGRTAIVKTTRVTENYGQAEVTADDGGTAVVQVRAAQSTELTAGQTALIFDYDAEGEFFWVVDITTGG